MKKPTILDWIKSTCSSIGWKLFIWGLGITPEEYWERIYIQERGYHGISALRRSGNSTRIVDSLIQDYFKKGKCLVYDHHPTRQAAQLVFDTVLRRLKQEHNIMKDNTVIDRNNLTIINLKHELHNN